MRTALLTAAALVGFAANSLLTRSALGAIRIDAGSFTALRLASGALTLLVLARLRGHGTARISGSWGSAVTLGGYAVAFTLAYTRIGAGTGALILFGAVQVTMIGAGLARGERLSPLDWLGLAIAIVGLAVLTRPGLTAPDLAGSALMAAAGACWGVYSLAGRHSRNPLAATTGNFVRATVFGIAFAAAFWSRHFVTSRGVVLALASGSAASGIGYTLWYAALPGLASWRAAVVQLLVPVVTAGAAVGLLSEPLTPRLVVSMVAVLSGIALTIRSAARRPSMSSATPAGPEPARPAGRAGDHVK